MSVGGQPAQPERQRPPALVLPRALLLELARHARHRPTCDRHPLAAGALVAAPARRAETQARATPHRPRATGSDPSDGSREPTLGQHAHPRRAPTPRLRAEQLDRPGATGGQQEIRPTALVDVLPEPRAVSRRGAAKGDDRQLAPHGYLDRFTAATEGLGAQASDEDRDALRASGLGHVSRILAALGSTEAGDGGLAGACTRRPNGPAEGPPDPRMEYWRPTGPGLKSATVGLSVVNQRRRRLKKAEAAPPLARRNDSRWLSAYVVSCAKVAASEGACAARPGGGTAQGPLRSDAHRRRGGGRWR